MECSYMRATIGNIKSEQNEAGGETVIIEKAFNNKDVDFINPENVRIAAQNAVRTANGLCELISNNFNLASPTESAYIEMYLALASFACEIYMKSVIYFEMKDNFKKIRGHKLEELFSKLPINIQNDLKVKHEGFEERIKVISNYFKEFRYDFEFNEYKADLFPFQLMKDLKDISHRYEIISSPELIYSGGKVVINK